MLSTGRYRLPVRRYLFDTFFGSAITDGASGGPRSSVIDSSPVVSVKTVIPTGFGWEKEEVKLLMKEMESWNVDIPGRGRRDTNLSFSSSSVGASSGVGDGH